jgi:hypothetical protein
MKAKRQTRMTSTSVTMLDGTRGHVTKMQAKGDFEVRYSGILRTELYSLSNWYKLSVRSGQPTASDHPGFLRRLRCRRSKSARLTALTTLAEDSNLRRVRCAKCV